MAGRDREMSLGKWVHFSVDDVIECFRWIYENRPESIFEEPMLAKIKEWHETYMLNCDLYVFEEAGRFSLKLLQDCYWKELKENRWLRLAWHRRTQGKPEDGQNQELQSLERTYHLITQKAGKEAWADRVRLHFYKADRELVIAMQELGVYTFLTNASGSGYDLADEESEKLCRKGVWQKARHEYATTDVQLDVIKDGVQVEELINLEKEVISRQRQKTVLEVFFHEWAFRDICSKVEQFWIKMHEDYLPFLRQSIKGKKSAIFPQAACAAGDKIYFTAWKDSRIFCMDMDGGDPAVYCRMPGVQCNWRDFAAIYCYRETLFLFPAQETRIVIVDMQTKAVRLVALPWEEDDVPLGKYLKAVKKKGKVWLVSARGPIKIIEFDMEMETLGIYDQWPEGVSFDRNEYGFQFFSAYVDEDYLYLMRGDCSRNIKMNLATHQITVWDYDNMCPYSIVSGKKIYSVPFYYDSDSKFRVIDRDTGKMIREETLETNVYEGVYQYRWVNPIETKGFIWYAPYKEPYLLKIDKNTNELNKVPVIPREFEVVRYTEHEYIGYDIVDAGKRLILLPGENNCLAFIDKQSSKVSYQELYLNYGEKTQEVLYRKMLGGNIIYEDCVETLVCFISELSWTGIGSKSCLVQESTTGKVIMKKMAEELLKG